MKEDLIKRLNKYSAEHQRHGGITAEAADAIEELQADNERLLKMWAKAVSDLSKLDAEYREYAKRNKI